MKDLIKKLQKRWGVDNYGQLLLILFIFAITGIATLYVRKVSFELLGITPETGWAVRAATWLLVVFPSYQLLFLLFGFIFGQFDFVWRFEKKSLGRLKNIFVRSEAE